MCGSVWKQVAQLIGKKYIWELIWNAVELSLWVDVWMYQPDADVRVVMVK